MPSLHLCCCVQALQENFFGNAQNAELAISLEGHEGRPMEEWKTETGVEKLFVYLDGETIAGKIGITLRKPGSKLEHRGIRIELVGEIETRCQPEKPNIHEFLCDSQDLAVAGELRRNSSYDFQFVGTKKKPYESYAGIHARLRYYIRVTMLRRRKDISAEQEVVVFVPSLLPEVTRNVKTEIGIGDTLHIELECNKWKYHLSDVVSGSINFIRLSAEISSVELQIIRKEIANAGPSSLTDTEIVASFEILDGTPKTGDCLPIRLFLSSYRLTPTMRNIESRFTVKYYLNLVIMDDQENKYFKQQELTLYRKDERTKTTTANQSKKLHKDPDEELPLTADEIGQTVDESSIKLLKLENADSTMNNMTATSD